MTHVSLLPTFSLFKQRIRIHTVLNWNTYHVCEENMIRGNTHVYIFPSFQISDLSLFKNDSMRNDRNI